ncbi:MAG: FAD:protein FMN transferase [Ruminococcus sp.]|nr:FAD:protein FMN transferase [Ruminococcus sp.]
MKKNPLLLTVLPLFLCSCTDEAPQSRDIFAMDTYMNIVAYGENADITLNSAESEIYRLEKILSVTDENSEVYKLNNSHGKTVAVCEDFVNLLDFSTGFAEKTEGYFDISIYPLLRLWGFTTGDYKIPTQEEIDNMLKYVDYSKINTNENEVTLPSGFEVDFGAVAKGYTSDKVADILKENGIKSAIINLGGNVHALGKKPDGSMWNVAVTNPLSPDDTLGILMVTDKAVVTSGNYQRYFTGDDGKNYCHIINPFTGYPVENGLASVTVIGESGLMCDTLSTALFVMGKEKAVEFMADRPNMSYILAEENGNITISENISRHFELTADLPLEVVDNEN